MSAPKNSLDELRIDRSGQPTAKSKPLGLVLIAAAILIGALAFWWFKRPQPIELRVVAAKPISGGGSAGQRTVLNGSGYVTARRAATVSSKVTGKVMEVLVEEGKRVEEGQILARLDDTNLKASLSLAEAQLDAAKSSLEETRVRLNEAELQLKRVTKLTETGVATTADLERAQADASSFKARLDRQTRDITVAERQIAIWQQELLDSVIRAPFAGIVISKNAQPGEMISPISSGGFTRTGICTIVDMNSLEIEVEVNESYINRVLPGQAVEAKLDAYPEWTIPTKVIAIIPTADRQKATVKVRVGFDQLDPRILPEMRAKVAFRGSDAPSPTHAGQRVVLPQAAVLNIDGRDVVFVVQNGRAERRAVTAGSSQNDEVVISSGVQSGERVALNPPNTLKDGMAVRESKP